MAGVAQAKHHVGPFARARGRRARGRRGSASSASPNASAPDRRVGREQVVVDRPLDAADRRGRGVVVRERGEHRATVALRPAAPRAPRRRGDGSRPCARPRACRSRLAGRARARSGRRGVRPGSSTSRPLPTASSTASSRIGSRRRPRVRRTVSSSKSAPATAASASTSFASPERRDEALADDLAHGRRRAELGGGPRETGADAGPISIASESSSSRQSSVTRKALPPVSLRAIAAAARVQARPPAVRRTNSAISSSRQPARAGSGPRPRCGRRRRAPRQAPPGRPPRRRGRSRRAASARGRTGADEVAHELERRTRPPSGRPRARRGAARSELIADEQVGDRRVQPVPLGVRVGGGWRRELADAGLELGEEAGQLAAALAPRCAAQRRPGRRGGRDARAPPRTGLYGDADDAVAVAVEHRCALVGDLAGELAHEPALARARLAGDERRATPFPGGAGQEGPQRRKLPRRAPRRRTPARAGAGPAADGAAWMPIR